MTCQTFEGSGRDRKRRGSLLRGFALAILALGALAAQAIPTSARAQDLVRSGTVTINQVQVAFLFSGNLGGGELRYNGRSYSFTIGGLGVGGIGASSIEASGEVYNLRRLGDFPGAYGQARYGFAVGNQSGGELWLQNANGVVLKLAARRRGLALSLGADAIYVSFD